MATVTVSAADFVRLEGSTFVVTGLWAPDDQPSGDQRAGGQPKGDDASSAAGVELRLRKVHVLDYPGPFEQFRLTFDGPSDRPLDQAMVCLAHPDIDVDGYLLVPSGDDGTTRTYESSFSVARPAGPTPERTNA